MPSKPDQIVRPKTLEEASALVEKMGDSAGLLWLGPRVEPPASWARASMIDLSALNLDYIKVDDDQAAIGCGTAIQSLVEDESLEAAFGGLVGTAARRMAHYGLRNLASVGGAVTTRKGPPELVLALLGLGADLAVLPGDRIISLDAFRKDPEALGGGLVHELRIPRRASQAKGWGLEWLARSPMDEALAAACAVVELDGEDFGWAHLAVAGAGWSPSLVAAAESLLKSGVSDDWDPDAVSRAVSDAVDPQPDFRADGGYQKAMMARLAGRAVAAALKKAGVG